MSQLDVVRFIVSLENDAGDMCTINLTYFDQSEIDVAASINRTVLLETIEECAFASDDPIGSKEIDQEWNVELLTTDDSVALDFCREIPF